VIEDPGTVTFIITHNAYTSTGANQTVTATVHPIGVLGTAYYYAIGNAFGATSKNSVDYQNTLLGQVSISNAGLSEAVTGTQLTYLYQALVAENTAIFNIVNAMTNTNSVLHHNVGLAMFFGNLEFGGLAGFNVVGVAASISANDASNTLVNNQFVVATMHQFANEQLVLEQVTNGAARSTTGELAAATAGVTYKGTNANWAGTVLPALSG